MTFVSSHGEFSSLEEMMKEYESRMTRWDKVKRIFHIIKLRLREKRHNIRMAYAFYKNGYAPSEFYSLDYTIAKKIVAGTDQMIEWGHGYPIDVGFDEWHVILKRLGQLAQYYIDDDDMVRAMTDEEYDEFFDLLKKYFRNLWD